MKKPLFTGACTALVTPFHNGKLNLPMMKILLQRQMDAGIGAVVLCGTTGESPTLSDDEKITVIRYGKQVVGKGCTIIAGTGSNDTGHTIDLSRAAEEAGADSLLVVSPYYNKATPNGLISHYCAIANAVHIPVILYNVPSRTGVDIPVSVYQELARVPNIAGVKEASTDITKIAKIKAMCPADFAVWSGNDNMIVPIMSLGGIGAISVTSNILPMQVQAMTHAALAGDFDSAAALQLEMLPFMDLLFCEVNPIPVKTALNLMGLNAGMLRLPLYEMAENTLSNLKKTMSEAGII